jgi:hypothetical protein
MTVSTSQIFYIDIIIQLINEYIKDDNHLFNCNKYLYNSKLKYFKLNKKYSLQYIQDINFKNLIHSKIINSKFQLSLNLSCRGVITDEGIKYLGNLHTLNLSYCDEITDEEIKHFGNLHTLNLGICGKITNEGIKHLHNLHRLKLSYCNAITDEGIKHLYKLKILYLVNCEKITDKGLKHLCNVKVIR